MSAVIIEIDLCIRQIEFAFSSFPQALESIFTSGENSQLDFAQLFCLLSLAELRFSLDEGRYIRKLTQHNRTYKQ